MYSTTVSKLKYLILADLSEFFVFFNTIFYLIKERLPMNRDTVISFIVHIDINCIASTSMYCWPWKTSIYSKHSLCLAQSCKLGIL